MESIHNKTGKKFTGKFAETAVRLGLAKPTDDFSNMPEEWKERNKVSVEKRASKKVAPKKVKKTKK